MARMVSMAGVVAVALSMAGCAPSNPAANPGPLPELAGRTAGPPQSCVRNDSATSVHANGDALLFTTGRTVWLNTSRCPGMTYNDLPVFEPSGSQYCRGDIVRTVDRLTHIPGPSCVLGDFVPYIRPAN